MERMIVVMEMHFGSNNEKFETKSVDDIFICPKCDSEVEITFTCGNPDVVLTCTNCNSVYGIKQS